MGIKNLHMFLRKTSPLLYQEVSLCDYAYKQIAVDFSIYLCRFKTSYGERWMDGFIHMLTMFRQSNVHPIFVFDTKAPPEKDAERQYRSDQRRRLKEKIQKLDDAWLKYKSIYSVDQQIPYKSHMMTEPLKHFLYKQFQIDQEDQSIFVSDVELELVRMQNTLLSIRTEDFLQMKELFDICQVPYLSADGEAEATCAYLCRHGYVDAVLSDDTDVLAYGCPVMLHRMNMQENTCMQIKFDQICDELKITEEQFRDFCIMCGTDYNSNIPRIGPEKAFRMLIQCHDLDGIENQYPTLNLNILNYQRVRQIFSNYGHSTFFPPLPYCGIPDRKRLEAFFFFHNLKSDWRQLYEAFVYNILVFQDETMISQFHPLPRRLLV